MSAKTPIPESFDGEILDGRYLIKKHLGSGSIGDTYLCLNTQHHNSEQVLKLVYPRLLHNSTIQNAFIMLIKSAASVQHPYLPEIHRTGLADGRLFTVLDYIPGITFRIWLQKTLTIEKRIPEGLQILKKLLLAMETLHAHGQFACLKPENAILRGGNPVITDFWLPSLIPAAEFKSNPEAAKYLDYLAPEILQKWSDMQKASDYYTIGAMLYEVLVGKPPAGKYKAPSDFNNYCTVKTDNIVGRALSPNPGDRYDSSESFVEAIDELLAGFSGISNSKESIPSGVENKSETVALDEKFPEFFAAPVSQLATAAAQPDVRVPGAGEAGIETAPDELRAVSHQSQYGEDILEDNPEIQEVGPDPALEGSPASTIFEEEHEKKPLSLGFKILLVATAAVAIGGAVAAAVLLSRN